jgi:hypothetical protein
MVSCMRRTIIIIRCFPWLRGPVHPRFLYEDYVAVTRAAPCPAGACPTRQRQPRAMWFYGTAGLAAGGPATWTPLAFHFVWPLID